MHILALSSCCSKWWCHVIPIRYKLKNFESQCFLIIFSKSHKVPLLTEKQFKSNVKKCRWGGGRINSSPNHCRVKFPPQKHFRERNSISKNESNQIFTKLKAFRHQLILINWCDFPRSGISSGSNTWANHYSNVTLICAGFLSTCSLFPLMRNLESSCNTEVAKIDHFWCFDGDDVRKNGEFKTRSHTCQAMQNLFI